MKKKKQGKDKKDTFIVLRAILTTKGTTVRQANKVEIKDLTGATVMTMHFPASVTVQTSQDN